MYALILYGLGLIYAIVSTLHICICIFGLVKVKPMESYPRFCGKQLCSTGAGGLKFEKFII